MNIRVADTAAERQQIAELAKRLRIDESNTSDQLEGSIRRYAVAADPNGTIHGYSRITRTPWRAPGWFELLIAVAPEQRRHGIGAALYDEALPTLAAYGATLLDVEISDRSDDGVRFAQQRGFTITQHFVANELDVATADHALLQAAIDRVTDTGIRLFTFADVQRQPDARDRLYELNRRLAPDLPGNDDSFPSLEEYVHEIIEADWFRAESQFIAADGDRWIGLVGVGFGPEPDMMQHHFSAVDRAYRGRGIGQALKAQSILLARQRGVRLIITGNDATNTAILEVNRKLGYQQRPGIYRLQRRLA